MVKSVSYTHLDVYKRQAKTTGKHVDITDRKEAIKYAIEHGEPGDICLLYTSLVPERIESS